MSDYYNGINKEEDIEGQRDMAVDTADGEYEYNKENRRGI